MPKPLGEEGTDTLVRPGTRKKLEHPPLYKVLLHNDDYTTRDFVVFVLTHVFHKPEPEAVRIMMHVHQQGLGVAGLYPHDVAETKVQRVTSLAREAQYPLLCTMEPEA